MGNNKYCDNRCQLTYRSSAPNNCGIRMSIIPRSIFFSHHKCGSTWIDHYLQKTGSLNQLIYESTHLSRKLPAGNMVLLKNASYDFARHNRLAGCHVVRNPLSVLSSAYFSHLRTHPTDGWPELAGQRALLSSVDRTTGMFLTLAFIERADFYSGAIGPLYGLRSWDYNDAGFHTLKMEDLVLSPAHFFSQSFAFMGMEDIRLPDDRDFAFAKFADAREPGQVAEVSHYRSGNPDDWRNHVPSAVVAYVRLHFRPLLERWYPEVLAA